MAMIWKLVRSSPIRRKSSARALRMAAASSALWPGRSRIVVWTEAGVRWTEAAAERLGEIEDALAERLGGQERLEELAGSLEGLMALSAEPIPTRAGLARNSARTS